MQGKVLPMALSCLSLYECRLTASTFLDIAIHVLYEVILYTDPKYNVGYSVATKF